MIPAMFIATILPKLIKPFFKQYGGKLVKMLLPKITDWFMKEFGDVIKYVREDNYLDREIKKLKQVVDAIQGDVKNLKKNSHEPKDFLEKCTAMEVRIDRLQEDVDTIIKGGDIK